MHLTSVTLLVLAGIALVTAAPPANVEPPNDPGLDPAKTSTLFKHIEDVVQHEDKIRQLQAMPYSNDRKIDELGIQTERDRSAKARDESAAAIAKASMPPVDLDPSASQQEQADHHVRMFNLHQMGAAGQQAHAKMPHRGLTGNRYFEENAQHRVAMGNAMAKAHRSRMTEHAERIVGLQGVVVPEEISAHLTVQAAGHHPSGTSSSSQHGQGGPSPAFPPSSFSRSGGNVPPPTAHPFPSSSSQYMHDQRGITHQHRLILPKAPPTANPFFSSSSQYMPSDTLQVASLASLSLGPGSGGVQVHPGSSSQQPGSSFPQLGQQPGSSSQPRRAGDRKRKKKSDESGSKRKKPQ